MWLIDFNNVAIEKIQPDTKPSICAYYAHTCIMRVSVCLSVSLCVLLGPYNNLFLYLFGKLRRNCPNTSVLRPGKPLNFLQEPHSHTRAYTCTCIWLKFTYTPSLWCFHFWVVSLSHKKLVEIIFIKSCKINTKILQAKYFQYNKF